jgi:hypothetical protein
MANIAHASTETATRPNEDLVGTCHRIAGIGPPYEVLKILDECYALIQFYESGEEERYRIEDIRLDPHPDEIWRNAAATDKGTGSRDEPVSSMEAKALVGQHRKIGRYGSRYQVKEILNKADARIRVETSDEDYVYPIAEILNDPVA